MPAGVGDDDVHRAARGDVRGRVPDLGGVGEVGGEVVDQALAVGVVQLLGRRLEYRLAAPEDGDMLAVCGERRRGGLADAGAAA